MMLAIFRLLLSLIRLSFLRLIHHNKLIFSYPQFLSYSTSVIIEDKGCIILNKKIWTRKNVVFSASSNGKLKIGDKCFFNNNCNIVARNNIDIGEHTILGPNVCIYDHDHDFREHKAYEGFFKSSPITIGKNVWIGANAVILRGSIIGDNSVIAAGTIFKGNLPSNSIVYSEKNLIIKNIYRQNITLSSKE